jgi:hypothetical protein
MSFDFWLPALRGEIWTEGALLHLASTRWVLSERAAQGRPSPPEVVEALAEGDRRHPGDPRRYLNLNTWSTDADADPVTEALLRIRCAVDQPEEVVEAIAAAILDGVPPDTVRAVIQEVSRG